MTLPPLLLKPAELSRRWQVPDSTLRKWRSAGIGPKFIKIEGIVRYHEDEVRRCEQSMARGAKK